MIELAKPINFSEFVRIYFSSPDTNRQKILINHINDGGQIRLGTIGLDLALKKKDIGSEHICIA